MGVTSTTGTLAANVANGRLRTVRPGSSFPVADLAPVTMEGRGGKQERGRMEEIKGSSLVGETTTVAAAVITIITTATTMDNITMATTTTASAVDSQMEEDASVTTDSHLETSMGTRMELVKGRTTLVERGATQLGGETLVVEICKLLKGFP